MNPEKLKELFEVLTDLEKTLSKKVKEKNNEKENTYEKLAMELKKHLIMTAKIFVIDNEDDINSNDMLLNMMMSAFLSALFQLMLETTEDNEKAHKKVHEFIEYMENTLKNSPMIKSITDKSE